ncbi:hypothetical protein IDG46_30620, partial [Staphylococcus sp. EG-SA-13]|nr:hypothetical protein [Staphylococcus sp. EG-SA-13]
MTIPFFLGYWILINHDHLKISNLIDKHKNLLLNAKQIIIDVRGNRGGSDLAYLKLLP